MRHDGMAHGRNIRRIVFGFLPVIIIMLGFGEMLIAKASTPAGVTNIVLVHGGFVDWSG